MKTFIDFLKTLQSIAFGSLLLAMFYICTTTNSFSRNYDLGLEYKSSILVREDSIAYSNGDTISYYTSGLDTIYQIYFENVPDSLADMYWTVPDNQTIQIVTLSHLDYDVNQNVLGINLSDFFEEGHANVTDLDNYLDASIPDPWQAVADLAPRTIRIFSGAGGKFMHPLGYYVDDISDPNYNNTYGGYGFYWKELIDFYDKTNGTFENPLVSDIISSFIDDNPQKCEDCGDWMEARFVPDFEDFYNKWAAEPVSDDVLAWDDLYINQFIDLVDFIKSENPGIEISVIYCVNILTQTASEVTDVIDYLDSYDIPVTRVELGNEVYFDFQQLSLGFVDFVDYWNYINGSNYGDLDDILPSNVYSDHNYILKLKGDPDYYNIKIGLPGSNTPNCGESFDFPLTPPGIAVHGLTPIVTVEGDCDCNYSDWNVDMATYYDEVVTVNAVTHYAFDAVILHNYYGPTNNSASCAENSNWRDVVLSNLHPNFDPINFEPDDPADWDYELTPYTYTGAWTYSTIDGDLQPAFDGIAGKHYPAYDDDLFPGNFRDFTRSRLDISYGEHAVHLLFSGTDTDPENKEIWVTEFNLDDKYSLPPGDYSQQNEEELAPYVSSISNSFAHAVMLQNWALWHLKANFDNDYRDNFLTVATVQNFLSAGSTIGLMTKTDKADFVAGDVFPEYTGGYDCTDPMVQGIFLRKATYFAAELWRVIYDNELKYLKTTTNMSVFNNNVAPTIFIDKTNLDLYVFYSNISSSNQLFAFDPGTLVNDYGGPTEAEVELGTDALTSLILDADQLYSTAGLSSLYLINDSYSSCTGSSSAENRFELTQLETYAPTGSCPGPIEAAIPEGVCLNMPPISMGYFKIPYTVTELRKGDLEANFDLYPNPTSSYCVIKEAGKSETNDDLEYNIEIYNSYGSIVKTISTIMNKSIDVSDLPVGMYQILIKSDKELVGVERLIKMK